MDSTGAGDDSRRIVIQHPLLIPVVLDSVFKYCPKSTWKHLRRVCHAWNDQLDPHWKDKQVIQIYDLSHERDSSADTFTARNYLNFIEIFPDTQLPSNIITKGYRHVTIQPTPLQLKFWPIVGPWLKRLHLFQINVKQVDIFRKLLFTWTPYLEAFEYTGCQVVDYEVEESDMADRDYIPSLDVQKNLKSLIIDLQSSQHGNWSDHFQSFPLCWMNLFSHYPNLKKLHIHNFPDRCLQSDFINILQALGIIRMTTQNAILNIEDFSIYPMKVPESYATHFPTEQFRLTEERVASLCSLNLPLTSLSIHLEQTDSDLVRKLIECHAETLQTLNLVQDHLLPPYKRWTTSLGYPRRILLKALTFLSITGKVFPNLDFLVFTPNLQRLELNYETHPDVVTFAGMLPGAVLNFVKKLKIKTNLQSNLITDEDVAVLFKAMPKVEKLEIPVDGDGFEEVCKTWGSSLKECSFYWKGEFNEHTFIQNVILLKNLEFLRMRNFLEEEESPIIGFRDPSIYQGLIRLRHLYKLAMIMTSRYVSPRAFEALTNKLKDVSQLKYTQRYDYENDQVSRRRRRLEIDWELGL